MEAWPPEQPKTFTPLVLMQHQGQHNLKQSTAMAEFVERGHIDKVVSVTNSDAVPKHHYKPDSYQLLQEVLGTSKVTKEIADILAPLETSSNPQCVLFEGAPGIGKSFLLKEIAYCWGKKEILQKFKLVLLVCLRDPAAQQMASISDLLQSFYLGDMKATEIASACSEYFFNNNGKDLVFLFDGYDEYPEKLRKSSLIAYILNRKVLPCCGLIISSRPHVSVTLRQQATIRVDILGFTKFELQHYIKMTMMDQLQKIDELTGYLQGQSAISSLCFVPFYIVVLVYLYKQGIPLPRSSAELYNYFICLTVCRHLAKHSHHLQKIITTLTDLPEPCNKIIQQLSKLSLEALNDNKLIFTINEIKAACPDITAIPGAINGFGLLQAVEHFDLTGTTTMTFNFLHISIQEYLAAHYITDLPADEELRIIKEKFWSDTHFNVFSIYIALTKGQRPSFKYFLSGGNKAIIISDKFLNNQLQCFQLYYCFYKACDFDICKIIEQSITFSTKEINLDRIMLTVSNVECITVFLTSSFHKEWVKLDFSFCYIQDHGLHILYRELCHCSDITINELLLRSNGLTKQSSSLISKLTVIYKVKKLGISDNDTVGEDEQLYSILTNSSTMLEELYMYNTELSSRAAIALFNALRYNNKLKKLYISYNAITDDACDAITTALERNSCLAELFMNHNPLTGEAILNILNGLEVNNTLAALGLSNCPEDIQKRIRSLQEVVNKKRESRGCEVKLWITYQ